MWWLADYYFRRPEFPEAEKGYKVLFQEWPNSELADEAKMMAGRAAVGWHNYGNAIEYFTLLTGTNTPSPLWAQAVFAYGDTLMLQAAADTNKLANYSLALQVFGKIHERFQTNEIAGLAWGEMAKCYSQMGSPGWSNAVLAFRKVIEFPAARVAARSEAQVGLGSLQEEMARLAPTEERVALLKSAAEYYWDVVLEKNLREGESRDAFWIQRAGLAGARLLGSLRDWERLLKLCERMEELLPVSNSQWQRRIEDVKRNLGAEKN
jgi:tetratricopeptide (TPR) repeat protein